MAFLKADIPVFSNAKNYRRHPLVPLVVPTVNLSHLSMITHQRKHFGLSKGFLVCNVSCRKFSGVYSSRPAPFTRSQNPTPFHTVPEALPSPRPTQSHPKPPSNHPLAQSNCAVIGIVIPFAALQSQFGPINSVEVFTEQAVSGAGYPGVPSLDIFDNVIPYISGEEDKLETEAQKILGTLNDSHSQVIEQSDLQVGATCTRVGVTDGHMAYVSLRFADRSRPPPTAEQVTTALREYVSEAQKLGCPSAPEKSIVVFDEPDRPQPRLDRDISGGYAVSVGRVREGVKGGYFDIRFAALSHNTVIGAAGSSILNAEAAVLMGYL